MVSPLFFTAPIFAQALAPLFAPVPPCVTSNGSVSFIGQPNSTAPGVSATLPNRAFDRLLDGAQPTAPAELPPQVGKIAQDHIDTRHTDAAKARAALQSGVVQHAK